MSESPCGQAGLSVRASPALYAGNQPPLEPCRYARVPANSRRHPSRGTKRSGGPRIQNARTELAAEYSLHLISCCALRWRWRRRRRPGGPAWQFSPNDLRRASVVTTALPSRRRDQQRGKNVPQAHHAATAPPLAGKVNVCLQSTAGGVFFPRRLAGTPELPPVPAEANDVALNETLVACFMARCTPSSSRP